MKKLLLLGILLLIIPIATALTPPTGGVTYYNFSSVTDLWGSNNATNNGADSVTQYPSFNIDGDSSPNSFDFVPANTDYVSTPYTIPLNGSNYSFSYWLKMDDTSTNQFVYSQNTGSSKTSIYSNINSGTYNVWAYDTNRGGYYGVSDSSLDNSWHHYVVTYTDNNLSLFVDGVLISTDSTVVTQASSGTSTLRFGYRHDTSANYYDGKIDVVKIYNITLNQTEIENLYDYGNIIGSTNNNFTITTNDYWDSTNINGINITINGINYTNNTGNTILTNYSITTKNLINISLNKNNYYSYTNNNYNISQNGNLDISLILLINKYINITDSITGALVESTCTYNGTSGIGSTFGLSTYSNGNLTMTCEATNTYQESSLVITDDKTNQTITRTKNQLILNFNETVNVTITDYTNVYKNETTELLIIQENLSNGYIFSAIGKTENPTQFYDYINTYYEHINESIYYISGSTEYLYVNVKDPSGTALKDATIRLEKIVDNGTFTTQPQLVSQRISTARDNSMFKINNNHDYIIRVFKDGYEPRGTLLNGEDYNGSTINIVLPVTTATSVNKTYSMYMPPRWNNRTQTIYGETYGLNINGVALLTDYRTTNGASLGLQLITLSGTQGYFKSATEIQNSYYNFNEWELTPNTDFNSSGETNITVSIWTQNKNGDWSFAHNFSIIYDTNEQDQDFFTLSNLRTNKTGAIIIFIVLLLFVASIRYYTNDNETSFNTFMGGLVFMAILSTFFYIPAIIGAIYFAGRAYMKSTGDAT